MYGSSRTTIKQIFIIQIQFCTMFLNYLKKIKEKIILVAKAQIGNEGEDKFWKWYGFEEHVH